MHNRGSFLLAAGAFAASAVPLAAMAAPATNRVTGVVVAVSNNALLLQKRDGTKLMVDLTEARAKSRVGVLAPGRAVEVYGTYLADGTFHCVATGHAAQIVRSWQPDR